MIAVTTIVAREKSAYRASWIGALWGLGHRLTIVFVGGAIILFDLVIPPRLGLTMEFPVEVMLILLGILNVTGMMSWIQGTPLPPGPMGTRCTPIRTATGISFTAMATDTSRASTDTARKTRRPGVWIGCSSAVVSSPGDVPKAAAAPTPPPH